MNKIKILEIKDMLKLLAKNDTLMKAFGIRNLTVDDSWIPLIKWDSKMLPAATSLVKYLKKIRTWGEEKLVQNVRLMGKIDGKTVVLRSNWNEDFLPTKFKVKKNFLWAMISSDRVASWYLGENEHTYFLTLPKKVTLDETFWEAIGLLQGEMIKSIKGKSRHYASFTNSQPDLVRLVLNFFERFHISPDKLSYQVILNSRDLTEEHASSLKKDALNYWIQKTGTPANRFVGVYCDKRYASMEPYGSVSAKYYNTVFRFFLQGLVEWGMKISEERKDVTPAYLRGIFAAEGNINLASNNSLNFISIGVKKKRERQHYQRCFKNLGIGPVGSIPTISDQEAKTKGWKKGTGGYLFIQGWKNFEKLYHLGLTKLYPKKELKFLFGLSNHRAVKNSGLANIISEKHKKLQEMLKKDWQDFLKRKNELTKREQQVLGIIPRKGSIHASELSLKLGIGKPSASRILSTIERKGFLRKEYHGGKTFYRRF